MRTTIIIASALFATHGISLAQTKGKLTTTPANTATPTTSSSSGAKGGNVLGKVVNSVSGTGNNLSNETIISGLKEALNVSAKNAVSSTSKLDGFYKNPLIAIPFPKEAQTVKTLADKYGLKSQTDNFVKQLNRAAETAAKEATPIFIEAITSITINDGLQLLQGGDNAATTFLQNKTRQPLYNKFSPVVKKALDKVQITKYWTPLWKNYNKYAPAATAVGSIFGQSNALPKAVNPDLNDYVTNLALDGLFKIIAQEETKIRKDPGARITDILKTVFG